MNKDDLDKLRQLLAKATPGPWERDMQFGRGSDGSGDIFQALGAGNRKWPEREANAELIVAAVNALPSLIGRIDMLEKERENGRVASPPGCEASPSAGQEAVFAESHPSRVDEEISAIKAAYYALAPLDTLARHRAMHWLEARFDSEMRRGVRAADAVAELAKAASGKRKGGLARAASLTPERRKAIAKKAADARWRARDTDGSPKGPDRNGLDGEAATAGAGTASPETETPHAE